MKQKEVAKEALACVGRSFSPNFNDMLQCLAKPVEELGAVRLVAQDVRKREDERHHATPLDLAT